MVGGGIVGVAGRLLAFVMISLTLVATGCATARPPAVVGRGVASTSFVLAGSGGTVRLEESRGSVVVIAFFTTYCPNSPGALRALDAIRTSSPSVIVLAVGEGESAAQVNAFAKQVGAQVSIGFDAGGVAASELGLATVPSLLVIDRDGTIRHLHSGFHGEADRLALDQEISALVL